METISSYLDEENNCKFNSDEEEEESHDDEDDTTLKEETCVQKKESAWTPSFFYRLDREVHHFVGQDILIQEALDSFAATTWPAAPSLCRYLECHYKELNLVDKAVLEIGSGTGLVAIVAALLGAWVTATDLPDALSNLRVNLSKNTRGKSRHTPQVSALPWGFNLERTYPTSVYHYDYVLAADVVYHHDFHDELLATMKHFCQPGTTLLWANKVRMVNDVEFARKFKKTFRTKLMFEDGNMKIFMATYRGDGEEEEEEVEDVLMDDEVKSNEMRNNMENIESVEVQSEDEDDKDGEETEEDEENGDIKADVLKDGRDESTCELDSENIMEKVEGVVDSREEEVELSDTSEEMEENEEEKDEGKCDEDMKEEPTDSTEDTQGEQTKVKSFSWTPSVIYSCGKDVYQYVGTDIDIYETIDSYGGVMWPAALALCSFLENNRDMVNLEDKKVLELGAGTGLVAIVASLLGARVTATDLLDILGNLKANVMRNTRGRSRHLPQIWPLSWSFDVGRFYPSPLHRFDYVLAADVVYHHDYLDELLATMVHFSHPRTTIIWANKIRMESDIVFMEKFKKEFDTTMLAEDGDMKIFMGKFRM